jgi:tetratricopeptide (TPR) repeat protein
MECYKKAASINPNYAAAFSNIGVTFYRRGYFEKAVEYFEKAIELDPHFDRAYDNKVIVLRENGEHNRALNFANKIHDLKQRNALHARN